MYITHLVQTLALDSKSAKGFLPCSLPNGKGCSCRMAFPIIQTFQNGR